MDYSKIKLTEKVKKAEPDYFVDKKVDIYPKLPFKCPKCGNKEAYHQSFQFSRSDEGMTNFLRCTKCGFTRKFRD